MGYLNARRLEAGEECLGSSFHPSHGSLRLCLQLGGLLGAPFGVGLKIGYFCRELFLKLDKSIGRQQTTKGVPSRNDFVDVRFIDGAIALASRNPVLDGGI